MRNCKQVINNKQLTKRDVKIERQIDVQILVDHSTLSLCVSLFINITLYTI